MTIEQIVKLNRRLTFFEKTRYFFFLLFGNKERVDKITKEVKETNERRDKEIMANLHQLKKQIEEIKAMTKGKQ